jgi:aquaporin Z
MNEYIIEYLGTVFFLYVILVTGHPLAIGAALAMAIYLGGPISGGHFNPAVSVMMVMAKKLSAQQLLPYVIAQLLGAFTALQLFNRIK